GAPYCVGRDPRRDLRGLAQDSGRPVPGPEGEPELDVDDDGVHARVWRLPAQELEVPGPLLIADGHHRYETAVAFREEHPEAAQMFVVLVSMRSPGLEIFPTHRVAPDLELEPDAMMTSNYDQHSLALYQRANSFPL